MSLARRASEPHAAMPLILGAGALPCPAMGYRGAQCADDAVAVAPVVESAVSGSHEAILGRGRALRTDPFLDLARVGQLADAPPFVSLGVTHRVSPHWDKLGRWQARIVNPTALFDPRLTGLANRSRLLQALFGVMLAAADLVVLKSVRRNRA